MGLAAHSEALDVARGLFYVFRKPENAQSIKCQAREGDDASHESERLRHIRDEKNDCRISLRNFAK